MHSTGHDILDMPQEYVDDSEYAWDRGSFELLTEEWQAARLMWKRITWAMNWAMGEVFYNILDVLLDLAEEIEAESPSSCELPEELQRYANGEY